jgi:hypothetical protein
MSMGLFMSGTNIVESHCGRLVDCDIEEGRFEMRKAVS